MLCSFETSRTKLNGTAPTLARNVKKRFRLPSR